MLASKAGTPGLVSDYPFPTEKNQISLEKCPTLGQGQGVHEMKLEHGCTRKQGGPLWLCLEDTGYPLKRLSLA